jgi:aminoglycoside phosphotransferase (APT) family kinase protein
MSSPPEPPVLSGIDWSSLVTWLDSAASLPGRPRRIWLISGGRSNLTYGLETSDGATYCLRRPPLGHVLQSAHDVAREYRILSALQDSAVPVPRTVALCRDTAVIGAPFYLMEFVYGHIAASTTVAERLPAELRARAGQSLVLAMVAIHEVDLAAAGLAALSKHEDYVGRQIRRWRRQLGEPGLAIHPLLAPVADRLDRDAPQQQVTTLVHGDLKLGNVILGDNGSVRAVLDWELATLGDPLADLGWLLASWSEPGEQVARVAPPPSQAPGFASRRELVAAYGERSDLDLSGLPYYVALAEWRWSAINVGVYDRFTSGQMGKGEIDGKAVLAEIGSRLERADELLRG